MRFGQQFDNVSPQSIARKRDELITRLLLARDQIDATIEKVNQEGIRLPVLAQPECADIELTGICLNYTTDDHSPERRTLVVFGEPSVTLAVNGLTKKNE